jgi:hypothetical protein
MYSCPILTNLEFSQYILKHNQISNFMNIRPVGAELFRAHRRAGMTKLMVAFRVLRTRLKIYPVAT